ncbi:glycoside hydrolase family 88 protein [Oceanispirochaeta sp.]|uniref:glycoside hydrolase family 88/105 protein n=1 Tax=Oceanispirochaeta sp. TaxID=2035350 RepID=UPI0026393472|nr:glycoside hydrolase family 88 protein [Oceanispirochaeta sp.]MDA3959090.1 glycoside hydrolase family 88 protein [Oceanispirochaeta sp.]
MLKIEYDREKIIEIIDAVVKKTMSMDLTWEWPCGVAFYGVADAYYKTGNNDYIDMLKQWTDEYLNLGLPDFTVNTCAMGHMLITLHEATGDEKYWKVAMEKVLYLRESALRFGENVLQHTVSSDNDFPEQAWADTLFMAAFFLLRVGVKLGDKEIINDALDQYEWHIRFLQNKEAGLWYHGYSHKEQNNMSGFFWGRANAWAAYTMSRMKILLKDWYLYPQCMNIECSLRDQLSAIKYLQTEKGLWRTVLDDEQSYEEISASCGIAAAMINNKNPLHSKYVQKALTGILENISNDGRVLNVSAGTAVMNDREGYFNVPKEWIQGWGQGLALAFLADLLD